MANKEGWYLEYFRETYKVWFLIGKEAGSEHNLKKTFKNLGKNFSKVFEKSREQVINDEYDYNTQEA